MMQSDPDRAVAGVGTLSLLASQRPTMHHFIVATRDRISVSYDPELLGNLKAHLQSLSRLPDSPWFGRKWADIGGHILARALEKELELYGVQEQPGDLTQLSQNPVIRESPPLEVIRGAS